MTKQKITLTDVYLRLDDTQKALIKINYCERLKVSQSTFYRKIYDLSFNPVELNVVTELIMNSIGDQISFLNSALELIVKNHSNKKVK